jgi:D-glycero-alpha-D-manno-heptose-7-phosphate kinase
MITVKTPLRISLFGGSTDYKDFYTDHGSLIIGTTINKYIYTSMRITPKILVKSQLNKFKFSYSKIEETNSIDEVENPLIRETFKYKNVTDSIEFIAFADIPSRTGLGGSSSLCAGMVHLINKSFNILDSKQSIANEAINIERNILLESGGIQDQIFASYGGFNSINIDTSGNFKVTPIPTSNDFISNLEDSMILIYTYTQREQDDIAKSHENKNKTEILQISKEAYTACINEDIKRVGSLLFETWVSKNKISNLISTPKIDSIISDIMSLGSYGAKLLGSGGCGFILAMCDPITKVKIQEKYSEHILDFKFEKSGVSEIYRS